MLDVSMLSIGSLGKPQLPSLSFVIPLVEKQMEKRVEHEMETAGTWGFKEFDFEHYHNPGVYCSYIGIMHNGNYRD